MSGNFKYPDLKNSSQSSMVTPCKDFCWETLYLILDNQAPAEESLQLYEHMKNCLSCYKNYDLEIKIRELLKQRIERKVVSQELIQSIKYQIQAIIEG